MRIDMYYPFLSDNPEVNQRLRTLVEKAFPYPVVGHDKGIMITMYDEISHGEAFRFGARLGYREMMFAAEQAVKNQNLTLKAFVKARAIKKH